MQTVITKLQTWLAHTQHLSYGLVELLIGLGFFIGLIILLCAIYWCSKKLIMLPIKRFTTEKHRLFFLGPELSRANKYISLIIPAIVFNEVFSAYLDHSPRLENFVTSAIDIFILLITCLLLSVVVDGGIKILRRQPNMRNVALKSYGQVFKIILSLIFGIAILALIVDQSPWKFISGLGALTALIALVFKDTILGFIASLQLSTNQLVREGDWVTLPKYGADGDVIEINLTTVKVRNFDMTITSIPTYAFISDSFVNWRGMNESDGRRIKRPIYIDMNTVHFCSKELLTRLQQIHLLQDYLKERENRIALTVQDYAHSSERLNHPQITNLGAFRHYVQAYLRNHDKINQNMTLIVRQLDPTTNGLPLEVYVFSKDKRWAYYEDIQSDIFDHLISSLAIFDLAVHQSPTGKDFQRFNSSI